MAAAVTTRLSEVSDHVAMLEAEEQGAQIARTKLKTARHPMPGKLQLASAHLV